MTLALAAYYEKRAEIERLQAELEQIEQNPAIALDQEFATRLHALVKEYDQDIENVIKMVMPGDISSLVAEYTASTRRRPVRSYLNPYTQERIETRGANHRTLKEWKAQYGANIVETWRH